MAEAGFTGGSVAIHNTIMDHCKYLVTKMSLKWKVIIISHKGVVQGSAR